jgi:hypothetical protein
LSDQTASPSAIPDNTDAPLYSIAVPPELLNLADETMLDYFFTSATALNAPSKAFLDNCSDPVDKLLQLGRLLAAISYRFHEKARVNFAEKEMGGDVFAEDKKAIAAAADQHDEGHHEYSSDDSSRIAKAREMAKSVKKMKLKKRKTKSKLVNAQGASSSSALTTRVTCEIRAPLGHAVAYIMGHSKEDSCKQVSLAKKSYESRVVERIGPHRVVHYVLFHAPTPVKNRELVSISIYKKISDAETVISTTTCEHDDYPTSSDAIRVSFIRLYTLKRIAPAQTSIEVSSQLNLGGNIPKRMSSKFTDRLSTEGDINAMRFFAAVRLPNEFDAGDSGELGQLTTYEVYPMRNQEDQLRDSVGKVIARVTALRAAQAKYRFLDEILYRVFRNKFQKSAYTVSSSLMTLNSNEAGKIGKSFNNIMLTNGTGPMAVDEWIGMYPALSEFSSEYSWFKPMMDGVATELMKRAKLGVSARAYGGAAFSVMDMISDVLVITQFFKQGRMEYAVPLIGSVALNVVLQLAVCWFQYRGLREDRWKHLLRNWLYVVTFVKPGVDAYRFSTGAERLAGSLASAQSELTWSKNCEMFCEAIPG